jgi:GrpB-like predicted nucleotidyltransferase (UPF0157 family)/predicted N-acetyltransferase YhbS
MSAIEASRISNRAESKHSWRTAIQRLILARTSLEAQLYPPLKMNVVFRIYEPRDFEPCLAIYRKCNPNRFPEGQATKFIAKFTQYLERDRKTFIVVEYDSKVIGHGGIELLAPNIAVLCYGCVDPEFQGQRIGSALVLLRTAQLPANPHGVFFLIFAVDASMPVYRRFGFLDTGRWKTKEGTDHPTGLLHLPTDALIRVKSALIRRRLRIEGNLVLHKTENVSVEIRRLRRDSYRVRIQPRAETPGPANEPDKPLTSDQNPTTGLIGGPEKRPIEIVDYDPQWPAKYQEHAGRIKEAIGDSASQIEHIGSTSVPSLGAKPIIDILLVVKNAAKEKDYLPSLEALGYVLRVREPDFDEHRMFRTPERDVHVHVFSEGSTEIARYLSFRDQLRRDESDRKNYEALKRELAARDWPHMDAYAEAKGEFIESIIAKARAT